MYFYTFVVLLIQSFILAINYILKPTLVVTMQNLDVTCENVSHVLCMHSCELNVDVVISAFIYGQNDFFFGQYSFASFYHKKG